MTKTQSFDRETPRQQVAESEHAAECVKSSMVESWLLACRTWPPVRYQCELPNTTDDAGGDDHDEDGNEANPKGKPFEHAVDIAHLAIDDSLDEVVRRLGFHSPMRSHWRGITTPEILIEWTRAMGHHRHSIADVFHRASEARSDPVKFSRPDLQRDNLQDPRPLDQLT